MRDDLTTTLKPEGLERLLQLWSAFDDIKGAAQKLGDLEGHQIQVQTRRLEEKIDAFEPAVTLIGQIKAGKTALLNSMLGTPGFLPSDVNPWTSVVTSLHLNARNRPKDTRALFRFFDEEEWDRLVSTGGRLGELAQRVGFEDEYEEIRQQIDHVREKSRTRLGKRFEMLLGTSHRYDELNPDLINRYVCHGGWTGEPDQSQGQFADITKIADLYLDLPGYPNGLCLRDTPGVNDTFMMREQITINAIRDSRLCIVVLSAHQALSTMDMALLRLIASVDARDVVVFVNRIDELDDPTTQVPEIAESFRRTLKKQRIKDDIDILFGSAFWALNAHADTLDSMPERSRENLQKWALCGSEFARPAQGSSAHEMALAASGVPSLHHWIANRIVDGSGRAMLDETRHEFANILTSAETAGEQLQSQNAQWDKVDITPDEIKRRLAEIEKAGFSALEASHSVCHMQLDEKLKRAQSMFAERAVDALTSHLELNPDSEVWEYDPSALRMMLRSAYIGFGDQARIGASDAFSDTAANIEGLYETIFAVQPGQVTINPPATADLVTPAVVGKTIALDLNRSWWSNWLRGFRKKASLAKQYRALIVAETDPILHELSGELAQTYLETNAQSLRQFLEDQGASITGLVARLEEDVPAGKLSEKAQILQSSRKLIDSLAA